MTWLEFIANLVSSIAWPSALVLIAFNFKAELIALLGRLKKIKHKETEFEFQETLKDAARAIGHSEDTLALPQPEQTDLQYLDELASISPRAAILEAWIKVEHKLWKHVETSFQGQRPPSLVRQRNPLEIVRHMGDVSPEDEAFLQDMRRLRNLAAHSHDFDINPTLAKKYLALTGDFLARWESKK